MRKYDNYINEMEYTYISGYRVFLSEHSIQRINERMYSRQDAIEDTICDIVKVISNEFMYKYLSYNMGNRNNYENVDVLVFDVPNNKVYALRLKPFKKHIILKTVGNSKTSEWLYANKRQRMCWIYPDAFKFSTANGNITWCK